MNKEVFNYQINENISSFDISNEFLVCGTLDEKLFIWRNPIQNVKLYSKIEGHLMGIVDVKIDENETKVAASCLDGFIRIWELEEPTRGLEIKCDQYENWKLRFLDNSNLATAGECGFVSTYNIETQDRIALVETDKLYFMTSIQILQRDYSSQLICAGNENGSLFMVNQNKVQCKMKPHGKAINTISFLNSNECLTGSDDGLVRLVDLEKMTYHNDQYYCGHRYGITEIDCHPTNPNIFISCAQDRTIRIWDKKSKHAVRVIHSSQDKPESINGVKFTKDGKYICSAHQIGIISFYIY